MCQLFEYFDLKNPDEKRSVRYSANASNLLPVEWAGEVKVFPWKGFCTAEAIKKGEWQNRRPKLVKLPVSRGRSNGVYFSIRQGVYAIYIQGKSSGELYVLTQPSTHYYKTMTGASRMPVLINQII